MKRSSYDDVCPYLQVQGSAIQPIKTVSCPTLIYLLDSSQHVRSLLIAHRI